MNLHNVLGSTGTQHKFRMLAVLYFHTWNNWHTSALVSVSKREHGFTPCFFVDSWRTQQNPGKVFFITLTLARWQDLLKTHTCLTLAGKMLLLVSHGIAYDTKLAAQKVALNPVCVCLTVLDVWTVHQERTCQLLNLLWISAASWLLCLPTLGACLRWDGPTHFWDEMVPPTLVLLLPLLAPNYAPVAGVCKYDYDLFPFWSLWIF